MKEEISYKMDEGIPCKMEKGIPCKMEQEISYKMEEGIPCKMEDGILCKTEQEISYKMEEGISCKMEEEISCKMEKGTSCKMEEELRRLSIMSSENESQTEGELHSAQVLTSNGRCDVLEALPSVVSPALSPVLQQVRAPVRTLFLRDEDGDT